MAIITKRRSLVASGGIVPLSVGGVRPVIWIDISAGDVAIAMPPPPDKVNTAFNRAGTNTASDAGPQGDTDFQPTKVTVNSLDAMSFDGGDELPITYTYGPEATWFCVAEDQGIDEYIISGNSVASHPSFLTNFSQDFQFFMQGLTPALPAYSRVLASSGSASAGLHVLAASHKDVGTITGHFDGAQQWNEATPGVTLNTNTFNTMGGAVGIPVYTGRIPELIIYPKQLSIPDILKVSLYLKNKWGTP